MGVSDQVILKEASSATETGFNIKISQLASSDMILSNKGMTKALIRLVCTFVVRKPRRQVFKALRPIYNRIINQYDLIAAHHCFIKRKLYEVLNVWVPLMNGSAMAQ